MGTSNRMERFALSRHGGTDAVRYVDDGASPPHLRITDPRKLAALVAFLKLPNSRTTGGKVFVRGQCDDHSTMRPSLFRGATPELLPDLIRAYHLLLKRLPGVVKGTRFRKPNLGGVLQHYGFRTPWLDVIDNLFVAVWFALNRSASAKEGQTVFVPSGAPGGWLYFLTTHVNESPELTFVDLREDHSSLNVRCHAQHGLSLAFQSDGTAGADAPTDFAGHILARVWVPSGDEWIPQGRMNSYEFYFPERSVDDTYRRLLVPALAELVQEVEDECGVPKGSLGRTTKFLDA